MAAGSGASVVFSLVSDIDSVVVVVEVLSHDGYRCWTYLDCSTLRKRSD